MHSAHSLIYLFTFCLDAADSNQENIMQRDSMLYLIHGPVAWRLSEEYLRIHLQKMNLISEDVKGEPPMNPCLWKGVKCINEVVHALQWNSMTVDMRNQRSHFHIEWLPSSIMDITLSGQRINSHLHTRLLPMNIMYLDFGANNFFGSFDVSNLPARLRRGDFRQNMFHGIVYLENTPPQLEALLMSHIDFSHIVVDNETLTQGDCFFTFGRNTRFAKNRMVVGEQTVIVEKNGRVPDSRVRIVAIY